jgi:hypothetical protein
MEPRCGPPTSAPNTYFRVWSRDARPDGYPDEIRVHLSDNHEASVAEVEKGDALVASNFFEPLFTCSSFVPKSAANGNLSEYCDRRLDVKMKRAESLEASDPDRANHVWATVDRMVVDQAVALPPTNAINPVVLSERVGNYQDQPLEGTLFDQLWVK